MANAWFHLLNDNTAKMTSSSATGSRTRAVPVAGDTPSEREADAARQCVDFENELLEAQKKG